MRLRVLCEKHACEAALAAARIENLLAVQIAEVAQDDANVLDTRIDGRREMLFVGRGFVEAAADAGGEFVVESLRSGWLFSQPPPEIAQAHALVRKIGSPILFE